MDEKTIFALTILLCFFAGLNTAAGKELLDEKKITTVKSKTPTIDLLLLIFSLVSWGYLLGAFWHVVLVSFEALVMLGSYLFGSSAGFKIVSYRDERFIQTILCFSWASVPLIFHFGLV
ncbi:hypothetical protein [Vibrio vulnificus]|uniref:hypothetical protein n=1 Tax=Vibrio vulnificus TaxID=672 RepID=UPI003242539D